MFQLGSALLDACVLAVVSRGDTYGYLLTQEIRNIIDVSESTLYPVLRRLQSENMLVTYDSPFNGRNRRYYQITLRGRQHLEYLQGNWQHFKAAVDYLLQAPAPAAATEPSASAEPATQASPAPSSPAATPSAPATQASPAPSSPAAAPLAPDAPATQASPVTPTTSAESTNLAVIDEPTVLPESDHEAQTPPSHKPGTKGEHA